MTVYAPAVSAAAGETITVPVMIEGLENLAGLKLVINYDETVLTYAGGAKTPAAAAFMHVVNDRKPGRLVLVMAGAQGIGGQKIAIFAFRFTAAGDIRKETMTELHIVESQLVSADLKNIDHDNKPFRVAILPAAAQGSTALKK